MGPRHGLLSGQRFGPVQSASWFDAATPARSVSPERSEFAYGAVCDANRDLTRRVARETVTNEQLARALVAANETNLVLTNTLAEQTALTADLVRRVAGHPEALAAARDEIAALNDLLANAHMRDPKSNRLLPKGQRP